MKISTALLAVPLCLGALACENPTDTEQPEALTNPPAPLFSVILANGCDVSAGVIQRGQLVIGTDGPDYIICTGFNKSGRKGVTVRAGDGNDNVVGSPKDDDLDGGKGCDRVLGLGGNDKVSGGQGNDNNSCSITLLPGGVFGGAGDDEVEGGMGNDDLFGDNGLGNIGGTADVCGGGKGADNFSECELCGDPDDDCPVG